MSQEVEQLVKDLLERGYGYIPVDTESVSNAKDAARRFIESLEHVHTPWSFIRPGEREPDGGVIDKIGRDIKTYLHVSHDLSLMLQSKSITLQQRECLRVIDKCRNVLEDLASNIAAELDRHLDTSFQHLVKESSHARIPYCVPTLRFLSYPDTFEQKGATAHYDRSFFTIHVGDSGGNLLVQNKQRQWEHASPPQGSALVFFGVKALELTNGRLTPCYHKSTTIRGKERTAAVMFIHADIGHEVSDAQKEYDRFYS